MIVTLKAAKMGRIVNESENQIIYNIFADVSEQENFRFHKFISLKIELKFGKVVKRVCKKKLNERMGLY